MAAWRLADRAVVLWRVTTVHRGLKGDSSNIRSAMIRRPFDFK